MTTLTNEQFAALKAAVLAEPSLANAIANGIDWQVADWCNATSTFVVWKTNVSLDTIMKSDTFDWTRVDNLTVGKARIWDWLFNSGSINPSRTNVRTGIDSTWVGTAADLAVRASVYAECKRFATNAEKVLATGTGSNATPGTMSFEGSIDINTAGLFKL